VVRSDEKQPFLAHLHGEQPGNNELLSLNQVPEAYGLLPWRSDTRLYYILSFSSTFAALPLRSVIKMSGDDTASEVYAKRLLLEEVGYSLWPLDQNVPQAYRDHGVSMDHVDKITGDGASKYKIK
jgi:hypothetical protein